MEVTLDKISKRFTTGWILRDISVRIKSNQKCAITGPNGSGKSTLISIISGYLSPTKGNVIYSHDSENIPRDEIHLHSALSAAYAELDEEFTVSEIYSHYSKFKPYLTTSLNDFLEVSDFQKQKNVYVKNFSSGMKQRLSLALTLCMDVPLLILDEPTSFLDAQRKEWYHEVIQKFTKDKTVIIASNEIDDYKFCDQKIELV